MSLIAFGSIPKDGGTYTFYRNMRPALLEHGVDLRCVTVGRREAGLVEDAYVDDGCVLLAEDTDNIKKQAQMFAEWCVQEKIDIVMAINSVAILSALPYLPKHIRVVSRCANAFDEGYQVTMSGRERLMRIIALTPRLRDDLVANYGADPSMIELIPNGIDPSPFTSVQRKKEQGPKLELGFLGRLEHNQKGVFFLPEIVKELKSKGLDYRMRIAGKGKHRQELERHLRPYIESGEVELVGALNKDEVPEFLNSVDVFLFTSQFEGCPNVLLEAMMAGCVPVAFLIEGITDYVLEHGRTGFIAPMGDCNDFTAHIVNIVNNPDSRGRIAAAAAKEANERFVPSIAAAKYANVFKEVMKAELPVFEPYPWTEFKIDPVFAKSSWRSLLPESVKKMIRNNLFHMRLSKRFDG